MGYVGLVVTNPQTNDDERGKPELVFEDEVPKRLHGFFLQLTLPRLNIEAQRYRTI